MPSTSSWNDSGHDSLAVTLDHAHRTGDPPTARPLNPAPQTSADRLPRMGYFVHESSYVDPGCVIGDGTSIWHFSHVMSGSSIGPMCNIGQNVLVSTGCRIGANVRIQNNVSIYTGVVLEDDVFCGPSMVFTNVINPRSRVSRKDEFRTTLVKRGATIGANATVVCGVTLGHHCFIGAGGVVTRDVRDYALVYGNPARMQGWMCECGVRLRFDHVAGAAGTGRCPSCGRSYRLLDGQVRELS